MLTPFVFCSYALLSSLQVQHFSPPLLLQLKSHFEGEQIHLIQAFLGENLIKSQYIKQCLIPAPALLLGVCWSCPRPLISPFNKKAFRVLVLFVCRSLSVGAFQCNDRGGGPLCATKKDRDRAGDPTVTFFIYYLFFYF